MEDITKYNKKEIFEAEIKPIVNNLIKLCNRERIPCFMTFLPSNTDKDLNKAYENFYLSPKINFEIILILLSVFTRQFLRMTWGSIYRISILKKIWTLRRMF
jgi:hypothetical protein